MTAILAVVLGLCLSCTHSGPRIEVDMYDGWKLVDRARVRTASTTFVVTAFDEGDPHIVDDESWTHFQFEIPDEGKRQLPLTIRGISGTCTVTSFEPTRSVPFQVSSFTIVKAIPGGFVADYDLGCGASRIVGRGVVRPSGDTRREVWPYDSREPKATFVQRTIQSAKDAWNGAI